MLLDDELYMGIDCKEILLPTFSDMEVKLGMAQSYSGKNAATEVDSALRKNPETVATCLQAYDGKEHIHSLHCYGIALLQCCLRDASSLLQVTSHCAAVCKVVLGAVKS